MTAPIDTSNRPVALISAYPALIANAAGRAEHSRRALWTALPSCRDADAVAFAGKAAPLVAGAMRQAANLTVAYLRTLLAHQTGQPIRPVTLRPADLAKLRGIDPQEAYRRPFAVVYRALAEGHPLTDSVEQGRIRLLNLAATDVQLAKTHTAQRVLHTAPSNVVGYRRGTYRATQLRSMHRRIHPAVPHQTIDADPSRVRLHRRPIVGDDDPGQVINPPLLDAAHDAIRQRFAGFDFCARAIDYRKVLLTHQHGELGPSWPWPAIDSPVRMSWAAQTIRWLAGDWS
jgi:hypothetical protein